MTLLLDDFELDGERFELRRRDERLAIEPLVFALIAYLASDPGRVFSRGELIDEIWDGRAVSDSTVSTCVKSARRVLGDTGEEQRFIRTVRGRGFAFAAEVSRQDDMRSASPVVQVSAVPESVAAALPRRGPPVEPLLLLLPFRCLSEDPEALRAAEGIVAELATVLTRIPLLRQSAEGERFRGADPYPTARQLHEDFGVSLVVDGTLQNLGGGWALTVQLSAGTSGYRLWAESFPLEDPLTHAIGSAVASVIGKLEPQLLRAMYREALSGGEEATSKRLFLQASGLLAMRGWQHEVFEPAAALLQRSALLDSEFALSAALLSLLRGFGFRIGLREDNSTKDETVRWAERALEADSMDSTVLGQTGCSLADIGQWDRGEDLLHHAIDINPANAQALVSLGSVRLHAGDAEEAVRLLSLGIRISPMDSRLSIWGTNLAMALLVKGQIAAAREAALAACRRNDRSYLPRVALAASALASGDSSAAVRALREARRIKPDLTQRQIAAIVGRKRSERLLQLESGS